MTNRINAVIVTLFAAMCGIAIFSYSHQLTDPYILPKWCFTIGAGCLWLTVWIIAKLCTNRSCFNRTWAGCIIALLCVLEAVYGITKWEGWSSTGIKGSFDNPAGFAVCLCIGIPFSLYFNKIVKGKQGKIITLLSVLLMTIGVILSESRSGIISFFVMAIITGYKKLTCPPMIKRSIVSLSLIIILVGSYWVKKDSADGRLLIARNTLAMIAERPLMGWGTGGWDARYMHCQADYFTRHPDSPYAMLADDVGYPYNEFLYVAAEQGLVGLLLVLGLLGSLYRYRDGARSGRLEKALLTAFVTFSLFSYPLSVFPLQMTLVALLGCMRSRPLRCFAAPRGTLRIMGVLAGVCLMGVGIVSYAIYNKVRAGKEAGRLYPYFRYNVKLMERYVPSCADEPLDFRVALLEDVIDITPTCEWYLQLGDACWRKGDWIKAEECYRKAASMIPHRLTPKFKLFELYKGQGDIENACRMARIVVNASVKKEGTRVLRMKALSDEFLQTVGVVCVKR